MKPDSVLARTAREVLAAHAGGAGPRDGMTVCPVCGGFLPCASGRAAAEVLFAAGLAESSGLVEAARQGLGPESRSESPFGLSAAGPASVPPSPAPLGLEPPSEHLVTPETPSGEWWPTGTGGSVADALGGGDGDPSSVDGLGGFGGGQSFSAGGLSGPGTATSPPEPVALSADDQPSGLSFSPPVSTPPSTAGDGLTGGRDARGTFVVEPDIGALEAPVPQPEPQAPEEVDPLLLGPPLFDRQNRPLDAPQFPRSPRPTSAMPASGGIHPGPPAPAAGFSAGQQGPPFREPGHAGGQVATGAAGAQPGSPLPAAGAPAAGWPPPGAQPQAAGEGGWSNRPQPGQPQGGRAHAGQPHAGQAHGWGQAGAGARPSAADVSFATGESQQGDQPRDANRDEQQRAASLDSAFTARTVPSGPGAMPSLQRPAQFEQPAYHGQPDQVGPSGRLDRPAQPGHAGQAAPLGRPDPLGQPDQLGQLNQPGQPNQHGQPNQLGGPVSSPPGPDVNDPRAGRAAPRSGRPPLEAPEMGQLNRPLDTPTAVGPGPSLPHGPAAAVGHQAGTAPLGRPPQAGHPAADPWIGAASGLGARPAVAPQMPAGDAPGNPATPSGLPGFTPATGPTPAATPSEAWNADPDGAPSGLPTAQPPQATPWTAAEQPGDDTPNGPSSRPAAG